MRKATVIIVLGLAMTVTGQAPTSFAQHPSGRTHDHGALPGAPGPSSLPHHVLVQMYDKAFAENIAAGRGFGLAFVADQNGYPGPLHVLELKDRLKLTADQEARVQTMLNEMFSESRPKSARLLDAEARLERLFSGGLADATSVRAAVAEVENARAEVRLVHLTFHLKARDVLTPAQRRLYHEARWGEHGTMR